MNSLDLSGLYITPSQQWLESSNTQKPSTISLPLSASYLGNLIMEGLVNGGGRSYSSVTLAGSSFIVNDHLILSEVPSNIAVRPTENGCFVGFNSENSDSRHVVPLGKLKGIRFMSLFRFKCWWTTHWVGSKGSDVEYETQMIMLDRSNSGRPYVVLLPVIDGSFSTSLQAGSSDDSIDLCVESGSSQVTASSFRSVLYMHVGDDPYDLMKDALKGIRDHLGTFKLLEEKSLPAIVDKFGWCTWDAFYRAVDADGVWEGVKSLAEGGCPPGQVIIDDGWQTICRDDSPVMDQYDIEHYSPSDPVPRLVDFKENYKFRKYVSKKKDGSPNTGMGALVRDLKETFKTLDEVYVWHPLICHWGGVRPNVPGMPEAKIVKAKLSPGVKTFMVDGAIDFLVSGGQGVVVPEAVEEMYEAMHSYLASIGIDGVKIDYIHLLELICEEYGGRIELAKIYYNALTASVKRNFKGTNATSSMQQHNDFMYLATETLSVGRVSDDFWTPESQTDPTGVYWLQGLHMVHCAYNSLWIGEFLQPDWDMFQSTHPCAELHAASRAISGGPVYISDKIGDHDFNLLKKVTLPDASVLRCEYHALPTRDSLFEDPLHDGKTMLKIWNLNKYTGVIGAFNCQGGGWCRQERKNRSFSEFSGVVTCKVNSKDVEWEKGSRPICIDEVEVFAVYAYKAKKFELLKASDSKQLSLEPFTFELLTFSPVKILFKEKIQFAAIGLINMLNTGGAMQSVIFDDSRDLVQIAVKGAGEMKVFASKKPRSCRVDGKEVAFVYDDSLVVVDIPWPNSSEFSQLEYYF